MRCHFHLILLIISFFCASLSLQAAPKAAALARPKSGEKNSNHLITEETAEEIWRKIQEGNLNSAKIARDLGVSIHIVHSIKYGKRWNHITNLPLKIKRHGKKQYPNRAFLRDVQPYYAYYRRNPPRAQKNAASAEVNVQTEAIVQPDISAASQENRGLFFAMDEKERAIVRHLAFLLALRQQRS